MNPALNISILCGAGRSEFPIPQALNGLHQVKVSEETCEVAEFLQHPPGPAPDSVVVFLDGMAAMPEWMGDLIHRFPQTPVMICSENREMAFVLQALQLGVQELLPLSPSQADLEAALRRLRFSGRRLS